MSGTPSEFEIIQRFFVQGAGSVGPEAPLGIGDDAAMLPAIASHQRWVVATDTLVEAVHFPRNAKAADIATRAMAVNISDVAAMGALPRFYTLCLTLPEVHYEWLRDFSQALVEQSSRYDCRLIGGDTTRGPLAISLQFFGMVDAGSELRRSTAKPEQNVYVTGTLGAAAAFVESDFSELRFADAFWRPSAHVSFAQSAGHLISACADVSDGLVADAGHIASASGLAITLDVQALPLFSGVTAQQALCGGDDYQLVFSAATTHHESLLAVAEQHDIRLSRIGKTTLGRGVRLVDSSGATVPNIDESGGYRHF